MGLVNFYYLAKDTSIDKVKKKAGQFIIDPASKILYVDIDDSTRVILNGSGTGEGGNESIDVIINDTLVSTAVNEALSANQGRVLNEKIEEIKENVSSNTNSINSLNTKISNLEKTDLEIKETIGDLEDSDVAINNEIDELRTTIEDLQLKRTAVFG